MRGPEYRTILAGRANWLKTIAATYGREKVVLVWVDGVPGPMAVKEVYDRIMAISGAERRNSVSAERRSVRGEYHALNVMIAPVEDVNDLADKIDFGTVTGIDREQRVLRIQVDPTKLRRPARPAVAPQGLAVPRDAKHRGHV